MKTRKNLFRVIAVLIPFGFFLILEAGLRFAGYGKSMPLFIENPAAPQFLLPRPDAVKRYFNDDSLAPNVTIETNFFKAKKPEGGLRIFVQGGSTAAGFPYGFGASIAGMLDYRLKQTFPDREVEVVNTALSAVNSYTLLDFADEIIEQKPDAVLIYAGHNEYLGILGVGSAYTAANSQGATLLYLKLKDLRLFQLMQNIYAWFQSEPKVEENSPSRTMMAKVAKHKNIPHGSELFQQGLSQFETNMSLLLQKYQQAGIPVVLSTIASNLAAQKPFSSAAIPDQAKQLLTKRVFTKSQLDVFADIAQQSNSADLHYLLAQRYLSVQDFPAAKHAFEQARQHDLLRFRAPLEINNVIRKLAAEFNLTLVDAEAALEQASANGIIGKKLMIEHLHPTVTGYFEISNAFYETLKTSNLVGQFVNPVSKLAAKREIPLFAAEQYWGEAKIAKLVADYPFTSEPEAPNYAPIQAWSDQLGFDAYLKKVDWLGVANQSLKMAQQDKDSINTLKAVKLISDALPYEAQYAFRAGAVLIQQGRAHEAVRYLNRALNNDPKHTNAMLALAHSYVQQQKFTQAIDWLEKVLKLDPTNSTANNVLPQLKSRIGEF